MSISNIAEGIGSQAAFKIDASTSLSMTFKRWVKCYIVTFFFMPAPYAIIIVTSTYIQ